MGRFVGVDRCSGARRRLPGSEANFHEPGRSEIAIESQGLPETEPAHYREAGRIHEGIFPLVMALEPVPGFLLDWRIHVVNGQSG